MVPKIGLVEVAFSLLLFGRACRHHEGNEMILMGMRGTGKGRLLPPNQLLRSFGGIRADQRILQPGVEALGTLARARFAYEEIVEMAKPISSQCPEIIRMARTRDFNSGLMSTSDCSSLA
ncbi:MAG TPA: hypothetical protein VNO35_08195 [Steroidobacteraceae bacterium]|nr:hypothetical protein [Steroidobacteraceae bacterium]